MSPLEYIGKEMTQEPFKDMDNKTLEEFKSGVLADSIHHTYPSLALEVIQSLDKTNQMKMSKPVLTER